MIKRIKYPLIIILLIIMPLATAQECPKIRVGVKIKEVYPEVFDLLNKNNNVEKNSAIWLTELGEILMGCLRENSPELDFIYLSANPGADYDYLFTSLIALTGGGEDVVVVPGYSIITGEDIFTVPPVYGSEYTEYKVWSSLIVNSNCFPSRRYVLWIDHGESQDITRAIRSSLFGFSSSLTRMLYERENLRPVPPREPHIETWLDKEYLSPLDEETRKIRIYEKVLSCNWQPSYYVDYHSQPVRFPEKTDRGEIWPVETCKLEYSDSKIQYILVNKQGNAVGEYTLKRGLEPLLEKITLSTCPLGNKPNIEKEIEIVIRGLELEVEPDRKTIYNGEKTSIQIDLHELEPDGTEVLSCAGREVDVQVTGVVDGTVSHRSGKLKLNEVGVAFIDYKAGQQDKQIKITATFTPPGYPEKAKGEATINIKPLEYDATLTLKGSYNKTESSSFKQAMGWGDSEITHELNENREASIYVPLKMEKAFDVEAQNLRYEFYRPLDINLSSFYASHRSKNFKSDIGSDEGGKTTVLKNKIPSDQKVSLKETMLQLDIMLTIDLKTDKVVEINMDGFTVEFTWNETVDTHHESWWKPPPAPGHEATDKTESDTEDDNFCVCPVEDPIPDPIVISSTEAIKKYLKDLSFALPENAELPEEEAVPIIAPDLLVKFGDGKTYFGGDGRKIVDNSEGSTVHREEYNFSWQVTRKKKP